MTIVDRLDGKTRIVIPRVKFQKTGTWRVMASIALSDTSQITDDVYFKIGNGRMQVVKPALKGAGATPVAPGSTAVEPTPAAGLLPKPISPGSNFNRVE